jgi:hypothetical protein
VIERNMAPPKSSSEASPQTDEKLRVDSCQWTVDSENSFVKMSGFEEALGGSSLGSINRNSERVSYVSCLSYWSYFQCPYLGCSGSSKVKI